MPSTGRRLPPRLRGSGLIAVAMGVMNVGTYGYTMLAARLLGPRPYGAFAGLMATLLVLGVLQLGLQATAARRIAAAPHHVGQIERGILRLTYRAALLLGLVTLLLSPALMLLLRLDGLAARMLGPNVRIGRPLRISGLPHQLTDGCFASAVGLALFAAHPQDEWWDFEMPADRYPARSLRRAYRWFRNNW